MQPAPRTNAPLADERGKAAAPRGSVLRTAVAALAALAVVTAAAEGVVRLTLEQPMRYDEDAVRGRIPRAGSSHFQALEGRTTVHYNNLGLHDPRDVGPKPTGERRVLVIGDSLTEAVEVADEDNFARRTEALVRARSSNVRVINGGRMAYLGGEMLMAAEALGKATDADALVVAVRRLTFGLDRDKDVVLPGFWAAKYVRAPSGEVERVPLGGVQTALNRLPFVAALKQRSALLDLGFGKLVQRLDARARAAAPPVADAPDWQVIAGRVRFFLSRLQARFGQRVVIVFIAQESLFGDEREENERQLERLVSEEVARVGFRFWSSRDDFQRAFDEQHRFPRGFTNSDTPGVGHLNPIGHAIVAEHLAPLVEEVLQ